MLLKYLSIFLGSMFQIQGTLTMSHLTNTLIEIGEKKAVSLIKEMLSSNWNSSYQSIFRPPRIIVSMYTQLYTSFIL